MDMAAQVWRLTVGTTPALVYGRAARQLWPVATLNLCEYLPGFCVRLLGFHRVELTANPGCNWPALIGFLIGLLSFRPFILKV
jgi:hypothetical protein